MTIALIVCGMLLVILGGLWLLPPMLYGAPWVPTRLERARRALRLASLRPGECLYDLGAGDGRVLFLAAREFGARAIGVEISPLHCLLARVRARSEGLEDRVTIRWGNYLRAEIGAADVVFLYLTAASLKRLRPYLLQRLRPGTRVVTISADFEGWQPVAWDREELIFLYRMPPAHGGWQALLSEENETGFG